MASQKNRIGVSRLHRGMPSLGQLEAGLRGKRLLGRLLKVHGPPTKRGLQIADGYVRLVEKAVLEYEDSRTSLTAFLQKGVADAWFRAQDHLESCIQSTHRAISYLDQLRRLGFRKPDGTPFVPRPRDLEVLGAPVRTQIRRVRDAIEHLDEDIIRGAIPEDDDVGIRLSFEAATLAGFQILYVDLAKWIKALHRFALPLSRVQLQVRPPSLGRRRRSSSAAPKARRRTAGLSAS
jgi:hypothetical protein